MEFYFRDLPRRYFVKEKVAVDNTFNWYTLGGPFYSDGEALVMFVYGSQFQTGQVFSIDMTAIVSPPVPEPSTLALFAAAAGLLIWRKRRA